MKIGCPCGAVIRDHTDNLPHKGHLIPDQEWFATYDAIDAQVIDALVAGLIDKQAAYRKVRLIVSNSARAMYQCPECGRLYIDDGNGNWYDGPGKLHCYLPSDEGTLKEILRRREDHA